MDLVLELTTEEIESLGRKTGHKKRLYMSLENSHDKVSPEKKQTTKESQKHLANRMGNQLFAHAEGREPELTFDDPEWLMLDTMYDEGVLISGTDPVDNLKFWASLAPKDRRKRVGRTKSMGNGLIRSSSCNQLTKREKLRKIAMVLYNAGEYDDSIWYSTRALEGSTEKSEDHFVTNALLSRATMCKLNLPVYAPNAIRKIGSIYWKNWTS